MIARASEEMGGQCLFAPMTSIPRILESLLLGDERLLKKTAVLMFQSQLSEESHRALQRIYETKLANGPISIGTFLPDFKYD
jgi:hypothetical protein